MPERHYNDDEVAAIFREAAEGPASVPPGSRGQGLTLRDLQSIAREVDISPDAIARAAQSLDTVRAPDAAQTFLGLPIGVERSVILPRRLSEEEWELLVVELRHVFRARGKVRAQGSLREWSNGNLQITLEPTPSGYQLGMRTLKSDARVSVMVGAIMLGVSAVVGVLGAINGSLAVSAPALGTMGVIGAVFLANTFRIPGWARERREQMEGIAQRWLAATESKPGSRAPLPD